MLTYNFGPWLKQFDTAFEAVSKNINNITTYVGAIIANAPEVFSLLMETLWKMVKKTFEWESLKTIFITVIENIVILVSGALKLIVTSIPEIIKGLLNALISYVKYLALSIEAEIIGAIEKAVNWVGREINDTWVGEKLGWGEELAVADFGADSKKNVARGYYNAAASSIEHIGDPIKEGLATISETLEAAGRNTMDAINSIYGDIGIEFRDSLNVYGITTSQATAIYLTRLTYLRHFRNFWGQIWVSTIPSHSVEIPSPCTGATLPYTILYLPHSAPIQVASVLQGPGEHSSSFLTYLLLYCMLQPQAAWRSPL